MTAGANNSDNNNNSMGIFPNRRPSLDNESVAHGSHLGHRMLSDPTPGIDRPTAISYGTPTGYMAATGNTVVVNGIPSGMMTTAPTYCYPNFDFPAQLAPSIPQPHLTRYANSYSRHPTSQQHYAAPSFGSALAVRYNHPGTPSNASAGVPDHVSTSTGCSITPAATPYTIMSSSDAHSNIYPRNFSHLADYFGLERFPVPDGVHSLDQGPLSPQKLPSFPVPVASTGDIKDTIQREVTRGVELRPIMAVAGQHASPDQHRVALRIRQQPIHARICGFGEKDRRPIDPPPIIELVPAEGQTFDVQDLPFYVLHCTLVSVEGQKELTIMEAEPKNVRILMGTLVSSIYHLHDVDGRPGHFFVFPDLSIRTEGRYRLKFTLMNLKISAQSMFGGDADVLGESVSEPFTAFTAKKFPGMMESSKLMKCFAKQGLKLVIRGTSGGNQKAASEEADVCAQDRGSKTSSDGREQSNGSSMVPPSLTNDDESL